MKQFTIQFQPYGRETVVDEDDSLLDAARLAGIPLQCSCGGEGTCGKCRLVVHKGRVRANPSAALPPEDAAQKVVLACQTRPLENLEVEVPPASRLEDAQAVADEGAVISYDAPHEMTAAEAEVPVAGSRPVVQSIADRGISPSDINAVSCAGNTTMIHLLLDVPPCAIRSEPFVAAVNSPPAVRAVGLGIDVYPDAPVLCMPGVSGFVGGDIVAGILAAGLDTCDELAAFVDVGTNGEIVIGSREWLVSCASSAGPAFEGSGIVSGVRAMPGAIQSVEIDPRSRDLSCRTIGDGRAIGLCGSGLVDLLAELFLSGLLDRTGRFNEDGDPRIRRSDYGPELVVAPADATANGHDIVFTEVDARNLIRSKGAIFTALAILVEKVGLDLSDIQTFFVAGGFGTYLNIRNAITIGLLPDLPEDRFRFVGNASLQGARRILLSIDELARAREVIDKMSYFELGADPEFMDRYVASLFLPHTDTMLFPNVVAQRDH